LLQCSVHCRRTPIALLIAILLYWRRPKPLKSLGR
jgi:hypothetical protein